MRRRSLARMFSDDEAQAADEPAAEATEAAPETSEADYSFEGYSVDFIDKVALMPIVTAAQSRR